jgi:hypothetical protein
VLGGDLNTWFGFRDGATARLRRVSADGRLGSPRDFPWPAAPRSPLSSVSTGLERRRSVARNDTYGSDHFR